jgi:hypothetical protein
LALSLAQTFGQETPARILQEDYQLHITRTSEKISVDGELNEAIWSQAEKAENFWMSYPMDGIHSDKGNGTSVMMTYDETNIYVAAICKGGGPYIIPSLKRDAETFWRGDAFAIVLDPVNEQTNGFVFGSNVAGVQTESLITGDTGRRGGFRRGVNGAWDNKWISEVKIYEEYWTVEISIPYKSLRFGNNDRWGLNFVRSHSASNSYHTWSPVPVQFRGLDLGFTGALIWDKTPETKKSNISVIPYVLGSVNKDFEEGTPNDYNVQVGGDVKVAIGSGLNLDLTINPDFSQVDVDQQVTNLTTVNLRFPERRLFFLENSDIYSDFGIPPMRPFFSRRIGLDEDGNAIPIAYGARLSGNLNKDLRIGVMNLQTKSNDDFLGQNYTSIAVHQKVLDRSVVKGYFHNRSAYEDGGFKGNDYNRTAGLEFSYRSKDGGTNGFAGYGKSWSPELEGDNYFYNAAFGYNDRIWSFYTNIAGVGNNYRADMGFIPRINHYDAVADETNKIGFHHGYTSITYTIYPESNPAVISHNIALFNDFDYTKDGFDLITNSTTARYRMNWANSSNLSMAYSFEAQGLLYPFDFVADKPLPVGRYNYNFGGIEYQTDRRKPLSMELGFEYGGFYNGTRTQYSAEVSYRAQPWGNFALTFVKNDLVFPEEYGEIELLLIGPKAEISFSRLFAWTTFLQYNTQAENFNINSRLQWRFQPMSDIFIVYSDNYATDIWGPKNRGLIVKMNYWLNL